MQNLFLSNLFKISFLFAVIEENILSTGSTFHVLALIQHRKQFIKEDFVAAKSNTNIFISISM